MSSTGDLTPEAEQLESAIRKNDVTSLKKIISAHLTKFNLVPGRLKCIAGPILLGASSCSVDCVSGGRIRSHSTVSFGRPSVCSLALQPHEMPGRKFSHSNPLQTFPGTTENDPPMSGMLTIRGASGARSLPDTRRGSVNPDGPVPPIFKNALHVAIQCGSMDVLTVLLASGLDPRQCGQFDSGSSKQDTNELKINAAFDNGGPSRRRPSLWMGLSRVDGQPRLFEQWSHGDLFGSSGFEPVQTGYEPSRYECQILAD